MKKFKKLLTMLFILSILVINTYAQKKVQISQTETIMYTFPDNNYCGLVTYKDYNPSSYYHSASFAYVFDIDGNNIFSYSNPYTSNGGGEIIKAVYPDERNNRITVCGITNTSESLGFVKVFNFRSGNQVFDQTISNSEAVSYSLSPNKKYIMTGKRPADEGGNEFAIINLETGQKLNLSEYGFPAVWFDDERILFTREKYVDNPEYLEYENNQIELKEKETDLRMQIWKLDKQFEKGKISEEEYKQSREPLIKEWNEVKETLYPKREVKNPSGKTRAEKYGLTPQPQPSKKLPAGKFINLYNINAGFVEQHERILTSTGQDFDGLSEKHMIAVDDAKKIYIDGLYVKDQSSRIGKVNYIVKLNNEFNTIWQTKGNVRKIVHYNKEAYFVVGKQILDSETGQRINANNFVSRFNKSKASKIREAAELDVYFENLADFYLVDHKTNTITFQSQRE